MKDQGYYRFPTINKDQIVFVTDDDLFKVSIEGGKAHRLTSGEGMVSTPVISPDGKLVAYVANNSGNVDLYLLSIDGGEPKRLTYKGINPDITWKNNSTITYHSTHESFHRGIQKTYEINIKTLATTEIKIGPCNTISYSDKGERVIGRNSMDSSRWKRYRGGTAGKIWVEQSKKGDFKQILKNIDYNLGSPRWIGDRIYFISDHEGVGNLYSVLPTGRGIKRLTHFNTYYVRNLQSDGVHIVFHNAGEIYLYNIETKEQKKLSIEAPTNAVQSQVRFESAKEYFNNASVCSKTNELLVIARGKAFQMKPWHGSFSIIDEKEEGRFQHPTWVLDNKKMLVSLLKSDGEEHLYLIDRKTKKTEILFPKQRWGKIWSITPNKSGEKVIITNNKSELWLVDLKLSKKTLLESSGYGRFSGVAWSPNERYFAYCVGVDKSRSGIKVYDFKEKKSRLLIDPIAMDYSPSFDPSGKYLYFIGVRDFKPVYSESHFDLGLPLVSKPYVVTLDPSFHSPFNQCLEEDKPAEEKNDKKSKGKKKKEEKNDIVFDGIENRVIPFDVEIGGYHYIKALKGKVFYLKSEIDAETLPWENDEGQTLYQYSFDNNKEEVFHKAVMGLSFTSSLDKVLLSLKNQRLRLIASDNIPKNGSHFNKSDGFINLNRINLKIDPKKEWKQMYREAWILQREHYWQEDMSRVDWEQVYLDYEKILPLIKTRSEMSDLMWEMQGELGTSHCYEYMGDYYKRPPYNPIGRLGGVFDYHPSKKAYEIKTIFEGDSWIKNSDSPLNTPGSNLSPGDFIYGIDGRTFESAKDLEEALLNKAGRETDLLVKRKNSKEKETVSIKALASQNRILYRQWVNANKEYVNKKSKGKLGYVHVPDMMTDGYAEFYRHYLEACTKEGIIIDVRFNGGGHISQLLLRMLSQRVVGVDVTRYEGTMTYPFYGTLGPVVGITNEYAGSDGDIFSHSFKLMKIGKLIGKRTWGGVIGINGQYQLNDGTITTQPEYSFWFEDVHFDVENYGTEPDIEVEMTPMDYEKGNDPQLLKGIEVALNELKKKPAFKADLRRKPNLKRPKLPKA